MFFKLQHHQKETDKALAWKIREGYPLEEMINVMQLGYDRTFHLPWWIMWGTEDSNYSSNWTPTSGFIKDVFSKGVIAETIPLISSQRIYPTDGAKRPSQGPRWRRTPVTQQGKRIK